MKHKMLALILALTVVSWAQTATQTSPADPQPGTAPAEKTKCACCEKMASTDSKDAGMSCSRHAKHGKEMASCCTGKNAKSCCSDKDGKSCMKDDKTAASCCKNNCGKDKSRISLLRRQKLQGWLLLKEDGICYELLPARAAQLANRFPQIASLARPRRHQSGLFFTLQSWTGLRLQAMAPD
jgi:hypothetical protein